MAAVRRRGSHARWGEQRVSDTVNEATRAGDGCVFAVSDPRPAVRAAAPFLDLDTGKARPISIRRYDQLSNREVKFFKASLYQNYILCQTKVFNMSGNMTYYHEKIDFVEGKFKERSKLHLQKPECNYCVIWLLNGNAAINDQFCAGRKILSNKHYFGRKNMDGDDLLPSYRITFPFKPSTVISTNFDPLWLFGEKLI